MIDQPDIDKLASVLKAADLQVAKNLLEKIKSGYVPSPHEQKYLDKLQGGGNGGHGDGAAPAPAEFKNPLAVTAWLQEDGWKISKSTLYGDKKHPGHIKEGKLRPDLPNGGFTLQAVQKYAALHLTKSKTRMKLQGEDLQRRKTLSEIERNEEEAKRARIKRMAEEGRYVLLEEVDRMLAARAVLMDTMRRASIMTHAAERVALVGGDSGRIPDLIAFDVEHHEEEMNLFASRDEFSAILPANTESDEHEEDGALS